MSKIKCRYEEKCRTRKENNEKCETCMHNVLRNYIMDYYIEAEDKKIPEKCPKLSCNGAAEQTSGYICPVCGGGTNPYEIGEERICKWCGYLLNI